MGFEFLILTFFLLILMVVVLGFTGYFISQFNESDLNTEREEFAQTIINEFENAMNSENRFNRTFNLSFSDLDKFPISFIENQSLFVLKDVRLDGGSLSDEYFYYVPSYFKYNQTFFSSTDPQGNIIISFETSKERTLTKLDLSGTDFNITFS